MNKNWLYRILAIALVAMLALPVFAMAEEVEAFELGAVELVEKKPLVEEEDESEPYFPVETPDWEYDFRDGDLTTTETVDLANPEHCTVFLPDFDGMKKNFTKKNSNSKVLTVSSNGMITLKTTGKATVTFTAVNAYGTKTNLKIKFVVKNSAKFSIAEEEDNTVVGTAVGAGAVEPTFKYKDEDGKEQDGTALIDGESWFVTYKSSKTSVTKVGFSTGELEPKKEGKAKITATLYRYDGGVDTYRKSNLKVAEATLTTKVTPNKYTDSKSDESKAKEAALKDEELYIGVRSAEYTKADTEKGTGDLKVVFYIVNGTPNTISKIYGSDDKSCMVSVSQLEYPDGLSYAFFKDGAATDLDGYSKEYLGVDKKGNIESKSVSWKKNCKNVGTYTFTFKEAPLVDLSADLTRVVVDSFFYKTSKKALTAETAADICVKALY